jgi:hypothetical protein
MRPSLFTPEQILKPFGVKKVLSKAELVQHCGCSSATAWRLLKQVGHFTSYNYNAKYYTLASFPEFDEHGLWAYRDIRFSRWGPLPDTMVAVIERSPEGMAARELASSLGIRNPMPLLTQLAGQQRLRRESVGGSFIYLAVEQSRHEQQLQRRLAEMAARPPASLPEPQQIIELLVEMIRHPQQTPRQWARRLARRDVRLGVQQIKDVIRHYHLTVKKGLSNS